MNTAIIVKPTICIISAMLSIVALAETETVNGIVWNYNIQKDGTAVIVKGAYHPAISADTEGDVLIPDKLGGVPVTYIGWFAFNGCNKITSVVIPDSVTRIDEHAFYGCTSLVRCNMPRELRFLGYSAFQNCKLSEIEFFEEFEEVQNTSPAPFSGCPVTQAIFHGSVPANFANLGLNEYCSIYVAPENVQSWSVLMKEGTIRNFFLLRNRPIVCVVGSAIRDNDPTVLDVVYKVKSSKSRVKVRVLAFEDGERSFAKVVRPETFIEGTEANVGDNVTPNVVHTISWRVSSDWTTKLAKVKFEVLACEGDLLPLELMIIPASDQYGAMKISWNALSDAQLFDALLWLTASKDSASFSSGVLRANGTNVAQNTGFANNTKREAAAPFIFGKMGYQRMTGAILNYANQETRLGLSPSGSRQYAYKMVP